MNDDYKKLIENLTNFHKSNVPIIPFVCICNSLKITVKLGGNTILECLDCGMNYKIIRM